ncbi:MAG: amidase family protein [Gemmatimonadota bacterium]
MNPGAAELAARIRDRELGVAEVVEAHIRRIREVEPWLNALAVPLFAEARAAAAEADAALERAGALGPLHGVPITVKEEFRVAGTPTTFGITGEAEHRASADGPLVRALKEAGAIVLGKTNVSQLLIFLEADNPLYGRTANPWDPGRTPGGSSGGEAALLAAGGSALGLAADLGGSIRVPAHFCGIHGLRPTAGRLTDLGRRHDLVAPVQHELVAQPGLLARRVEDLALGMELLAGRGSREDPALAPLPWADPAGVELGGLRVALFTDDGYFPASPAIRRVVEEAGRALTARGAVVERWAPAEVGRAVELLFSLLSADGGAAYREALGGDRPRPQIAGLMRATKLSRPLRHLLAGGLARIGQRRLADVTRCVGRRSAAGYWKLVESRRAYRRRFLEELNAGGYDLVLCPPAALPAVPHGDTAALPGFASYAMLFNVLEFPAGVVAAGRVRSGEESDRGVSRDRVERAARRAEAGSAGLPVGVQLAGRPWEEAAVLAAMAVLEEHFRSSPEYPDLPTVRADGSPRLSSDPPETAVE